MGDENVAQSRIPVVVFVDYFLKHLGLELSEYKESVALSGRREVEADTAFVADGAAGFDFH